MCFQSSNHNPVHLHRKQTLGSYHHNKELVRGDPSIIQGVWVFSFVPLLNFQLHAAWPYHLPWWNLDMALKMKNSKCFLSCFCATLHLTNFSPVWFVKQHHGATIIFSQWSWWSNLAPINNKEFSWPRDILILVALVVLVPLRVFLNRVFLVVEPGCWYFF